MSPMPPVAEAPLASQSAPAGHTMAGRGGAGGWLRRNAQIVVGLLISGWSIWQLAQAIDPVEVGRHLAGSNWLLLGLCFLSIPCSMMLKVIRQRCLFNDAGRAPGLRPLISALYIGYLMNTVLPARVGEFVRAYLIGREPGVGVSPALATIVVEKVLDLLTLGLILAGLVAFQQLPELPGWMQASVVVSAWALGGGLVGLVLVLALRRQAVALVGFFEERVPLLRRIGAAALASSFLAGLAVLARPGKLPAIIFWSVAIWASAGFTMWSGLAGVGILASVPAVALALVVTNLGMAVPSAPGYVGVFHQLLIESLLPYGIDRNHAAGAAIVMHALVFGNFIIGGIWCLWRGGHSMGSLRDASGH